MCAADLGPDHRFLLPASVLMGPCSWWWPTPSPGRPGSVGDPGGVVTAWEEPFLCLLLRKKGHAIIIRLEEAAFRLREREIFSGLNLALREGEISA